MCLAVPMKVIEILDDNRAVVGSGDISLVVSLQLIEKPEVDDYLIVHAGCALERLDPEHANEILQSLNELALCD